MILNLLLSTIASMASAPVPVAHAAPVVVASRPGGRVSCRNEFGATSLVRRTRVCHTAGEWGVLDAHRIARRQGR